MAQGARMGSTLPRDARDFPRAQYRTRAAGSGVSELERRLIRAEAFSAQTDKLVESYNRHTARTDTGFWRLMTRLLMKINQRGESKNLVIAEW
jgi:hypothetical protein